MLHSQPGCLPGSFRRFNLSPGPRVGSSPPPAGYGSTSDIPGQFAAWALASGTGSGRRAWAFQRLGVCRLGVAGIPASPGFGRARPGRAITAAGSLFGPLHCGRCVPIQAFAPAVSGIYIAANTAFTTDSTPFTNSIPTGIVPFAIFGLRRHPLRPGLSAFRDIRIPPATGSTSHPAFASTVSFHRFRTNSGFTINCISTSLITTDAIPFHIAHYPPSTFYCFNFPLFHFHFRARPHRHRARAFPFLFQFSQITNFQFRLRHRHSNSPFLSFSRPAARAWPSSGSLRHTATTSGFSFALSPIAWTSPPGAFTVIGLAIQAPSCSSRVTHRAPAAFARRWFAPARRAIARLHHRPSRRTRRFRTSRRQ